MQRPPLIRVAPGIYQTRDHRFGLERRMVLGPRGGQHATWWLTSNNGTALRDPGPYRSLDAAGAVLLPLVRGTQFARGPGLVYMACLDRPLRHARHYKGFTNRESVKEREAEHRAGRGSRLLAAANRAGIGWEIVAIWPGGRDLEHKIKQHGGSRICPRCKARGRKVPSTIYDTDTATWENEGGAIPHPKEDTQ